jgi:fido (protein-threonine AMPylation protein)
MEREKSQPTGSINRFGARNGMTEPELRQLENRLGDQQLNPVRGNYDLAHLQAIHANTFRSVVGDSAGELRQIDLAKRGQDGLVSTFVAAKDIATGGEVVAQRIKDADQFRGLTKDAWANGIAQTYADLNQLHPFRNGNDTANREFVRVLGREGGFDVDYSKVDVQAWQKASIESFKGNIESVEKIIRQISEPVRDLNRDGQAREGFRIDRDASALLSAQSGNDRVAREAQRLGVEIMKPNELATLEGNVKGVVIAAKDDFVLIKTSATKALAIDRESVQNFDVETGRSVVIRRESDAIYFEGQGNAKDRSNEIGHRLDRGYGDR